MSWNGEIVIDLDSHIVERVDRFYGDYIDPAYRDHYGQLCDAIAQQAKAGHRYSLFGSRTSIVETIETGRWWGISMTAIWSSKVRPGSADGSITGRPPVPGA